MILLTNSHAGTHADTPHHWMTNPPFDQFDASQYNGTAQVLNLAPYLNENKAITQSILERAAMLSDVDLGKVRRLLVRTYDKIPEQWDPGFAYFDPGAARYLGKLPRLVMIGIDAPSVDHHSASPIHTCSHGGFWQGRVAILEGLKLDTLPKKEKINGVLQTTLQPIPGVKDAQPATVTFYMN